MRVLFENPVVNAALSAGAASANYPVSNLAHPFLLVRYQPTASTDTVTLTFAAAIAINCMFWGYTNATEFTLRLYDAADTLLHTETVTDPDSVGAVYFAEVDAVAYAELDLTGAITVYLGGLGLGVYYQMPDPLATWKLGSTDNSATSGTAFGQVTQNYAKPLRSFELSFSGVSYDQASEIQDKCEVVGKGGKLWVDITESDHSFLSPLYSALADVVEPAKDGQTMTFAFKFAEAR